ncbi:MAG: glycosyltransferase family 4 protein [Elusimicrobia bacterium]|nr:glycosyltransferase family 4 protein [Candidatus Liberimonas magnetica]
MRIAIDGRALNKYKPDSIGSELSEAVNSIAGIRKDWELLVILNQFGEFKPVLPNVNTLSIKEFLSLAADQIAIPRLLKRHNIDVFYSPYFRCPVLSKARKIITIHNFTYLVLKVLYAEKDVSQSIKLNIAWKKILADSASKIVAQSQNSANDIVNILKIREDKISVVSPSISNNFMPQNEENITAVMKKYAVTKPYILYVGNSRPYKNVDNLVKAFEKLPKTFRDEYNLVLAGVGEFKTGLKNCITIDFIRHNNDDLPSLYSGAKLFVFPSLYEGFCFAPLEAIACGCPVLSSNTSSMPEILNDACSYFNPNNIEELSKKIHTILNTTSLLEELREKGLKRASHFSITNSSNEFIKLIETLISG